MAVTEVTGADQAAAIGTEHTLTTQTTAAIYVLVVDTSAMANGDALELRLKTKARSGGTSRVAYIANFKDVQGQPIKYSVPVPANVEVVATLKQIAGTGRTFTWALLAL